MNPYVNPVEMTLMEHMMVRQIKKTSINYMIIKTSH